MIKAAMMAKIIFNGAKYDFEFGASLLVRFQRPHHFSNFRLVFVYFGYTKSSVSICRRLSLGLVAFSEVMPLYESASSIVTIAPTKKVF